MEMELIYSACYFIVIWYTLGLVSFCIPFLMDAPNWKIINMHKGVVLMAFAGPLVMVAILMAWYREVTAEKEALKYFSAKLKKDLEIYVKDDKNN